jgi:phosphopantothenoylcysteine decarboxylase/phosphopantothenate--cysteine ligase
MARILLGVSGGIAAYKALELARLATTAGHGVRVVMTRNAQRFVGAASFEGIVGSPVLVDEFEHDAMRGGYPGDELLTHDPIGHLALAQNADAMLVAPASANTLAKLAAGICDSMLTTSFCATTAPRAVAPAMNDKMYADAATQANVETLIGRGVMVIPPESGALASRGESGMGRLPAPDDLMRSLEAMVWAPGPWDGLRVLVTAGGTREPIDPVRFIGNRSSGRMGIALARAAAKRGAEVTLVSANVNPSLLPAGMEHVRVETTQELGEAVRERFADAHVLLMAAAPADFRTVDSAESKISRSKGELDLRLAATEDILAGVAASKRADQTVVGFAAETGADAIERARVKLERKGADAIVFNDVSRSEIGFDSGDNEVTIVEHGGEHHVPLASKDDVAGAILDRVEALRAARSPS